MRKNYLYISIISLLLAAIFAAGYANASPAGSLAGDIYGRGNTPEAFFGGVTRGR